MVGNQSHTPLKVTKVTAADCKRYALPAEAGKGTGLSTFDKTVELLISQVFYRQNCVYNIGIVNIMLVFNAT